MSSKTDPESLDCNENSPLRRLSDADRTRIRRKRMRRDSGPHHPYGVAAASNGNGGGYSPCSTTDESVVPSYRTAAEDGGRCTRTTACGAAILVTSFYAS